MTTRNMPPRLLAIVAELRAAGEHDEADAIEAPYIGTAPAVSGSPGEVADAQVKVIEAQTEHDVAVIEATADAAEQVVDAQADADASHEVAEHIGEDGDGGVGDVEADHNPDDDHWFTRTRDGWKASRS